MNSLFDSIQPWWLFILIIGIWAYIFIRNNTTHEIERGLEPIYSKRCTAYIDGFKNVWSRFTIYDEFLVISSRKKIILNFEEILGTDTGRVLWSKSLEIKHQNKKAPSIALLLSDFSKPREIIENKLNRKPV